MDDTLLVSRLQTFCNLAGTPERFPQRHGAQGNLVSERQPRDQFQNYKPILIPVLEPINRGNILMIQRGENPRFPLEPGKAERIVGQGLGQYLDGYLPTKLGVERLVHFPHPACTKRAEYLVGTESCTSNEGHKT